MVTPNRGKRRENNGMPPKLLGAALNEDLFASYLTTLFEKEGWEPKSPTYKKKVSWVAVTEAWSVLTKCPHGQEIGRDISHVLIKNADPMSLAVMVFDTLKRECRAYHSALPAAFNVAIAGPVGELVTAESLVPDPAPVPMPVSAPWGSVYVAGAYTESVMYEAVGGLVWQALPGCGCPMCKPSGGSPLATATSWKKISDTTKIELPPVVADLARLVPAVLDHHTECPEGCVSLEPLPIYQIVIHLNDYHRYQREKIADWLETLDVDLTLQPCSQGD